MKKMFKSTFILALLLVVALAGCSSKSTSGDENTTASNQNEWPEVLRFGSIPGENQQEISRRYQNMIDALSKELGIKVEMFVGTDYTAVIEAMRNKKLDVAEFGPFSYIIAKERSNATAFSTPAKSETEAFYQSYIIVPAKSTATSIQDLKGKKMLYVDPASTSGNLFPRAMVMKETGLAADQVDSFFGNVSFSGGHDASILAVANGDADAAAAASSTLEQMIKKGVIKESDVKIIAKSEPIPNDAIAYRGDLPKDLVEKVDSFFKNYKDQQLFEELDINGFYPVEDKQYDVVRDVAKSLNLSPEQLLK